MIKPASTHDGKIKDGSAYEVTRQKTPQAIKHGEQSGSTTT